MAGINKDGLKRARELAGYTPTQLAKDAGISLTYLCDLESGHRTAKRKPDLVKKLADTLGVPRTWIEHSDLTEAS